MKSSRGFLSTVPRKSLFIFLLGVFLLFGTTGLASDMAELGRQPLLRLALSILLYSTFAIFYAVVGFKKRGPSWVMIPIFIAQFAAINGLQHWLPSYAPLQQMDAATIARVQHRVHIDSVALVVMTCLAYACFVYASITEGRRYFLAHAEIALAQEIHQVLVPTIDLKMGGFEFYGRSSPSGEVGGDLIDVAGTDANWVAYLADVSGHGVAPGLVMGMVKSAARMLLSSGEGSDRLMPRLNEVLYPLKKPDMFITFCFVTASEGKLHVGLAGHPSVLQLSMRANEVTEHQCPNMPLGIVPEGEFSTSAVEADEVTLFALYTDGFLEAANAKGEEFGIARLKAELQKHGNEPLEAICRSISESVARHGAQFDDQSILLIRKVSS